MYPYYIVVLVSDDDFDIVDSLGCFAAEERTSCAGVLVVVGNRQHDELLACFVVGG